MATVREGNQTVLVVVDVQVGVVASAWDVERIVGNVAQAVERARRAGVPVFWVQHSDNDLVRESPAWQWVPQLVPRDAEVRIHKRFESSFEQTDLEAQLARHDATRIVLAGASTNWCIRATAYAALERGYDLTLVSDAHTTTTIELEGGTKVEAAGIVTDLNVTMTWLNYPGRRNSTARAAEIDFSAAPAAAAA
ncbi:MAG TPA: isochorismatase family protein [Burkholderiaceae bacterium]|nr:isochorismatase family protein [Burkholderiaceae bacterium]